VLLFSMFKHSFFNSEFSLQVCGIRIDEVGGPCASGDDALCDVRH
jgi:hypothetical protein